MPGTSSGMVSRTVAMLHYRPHSLCAHEYSAPEVPIRDADSIEDIARSSPLVVFITHFMLLSVPANHVLCIPDHIPTTIAREYPDALD